MSKRIVLVNQDSGYLFIDLVNAFAEKYDEVIFMAGRIVRMSSELNPKVRICKIRRYNRKNSFTRAFSWIVSTVQVFSYLMLRYRRHELLFSTNPPTLIFILLIMKRPYSLLVFDLYPDGLIAGKFLKSDNLLIKLWSWVNRKVFKRAESIFTLTKGMAKSLSQYVNSNFVNIVPAWSSDFILSDYTDKQNPFIEKYQLEGKFIIMYSGNLGKEHEVETMVNLAEELKNDDDIIVLIAGTGWKFDMLDMEIRKKQLTNCRLLPKQSVELFQAALSAIKLGVVSLTQSVANVAIPSKTYNILAAGKPILCIGGENSDLAMLLKETKTGAAFSSEKLNEMAAFVLALHQNPVVYKQYCNNALTTSNEFTAANAHLIVKIHEESLRTKKYQKLLP